MPGILPMKVIKIGSSSQTRIAQACDRCRSKKIRCDGIRPCCTQCANVGFECKTSDKLSRRAFPRGYTESLEERVRALEAEVRELKDLLDEKDEKLDMLSRIHSHSPKTMLHASPRRPSDSSTELAPEEHPILDDSDECFKVRTSTAQVGRGPDVWKAGPSSTAAFFDSFKQRAREHKLNLQSFAAADVLPQKRSSTTVETSTQSLCAPPRMLSDQLINIFFQEWAPLFPILHRPTFLATYGRYVAEPDSIIDLNELACLNLVFAIAAAACGIDTDETATFDAQWKRQVEAVLSLRTTDTLQSVLLAQIRCLQSNDLVRLKALTATSAALVTETQLYVGQSIFDHDVLSSEMRKRLFWTHYTIDCFAATVLGLPQQHVNDNDISCEYPTDADDEYISSQGIQPSLPGEMTKLSSALALFNAARILSRVLSHVLPIKASHELSLKQLADFLDELELWEASLPSHLRLPFAQDKPSTGTITSRSPVLSFVYYYIRALIQRPAINSASLGSKASSAVLVHTASCKRMVQILHLLRERGLTFSFCLSHDEVLVLCATGMLSQRLVLGTAHKVLKDNSHTLGLIHQELALSTDSCADKVLDLVKHCVPNFEPLPPAQHKTRTLSSFSKPSIARGNSDFAVLPEQVSNLPSSTRRQLKAIASRFSSNINKRDSFNSDVNDLTSAESSEQYHKKFSRQAPSLTPMLDNSPSIAGTSSDVPLSPLLAESRPGSIHCSSTSPQEQAKKALKRQTMPARTNLDYLSFGNEPAQAITVDEVPIKTEPQQSDWEKLLGDLDNGSTNIFDASYGGRPIEALAESTVSKHTGTRTAMSDAALAWNAGLLTLQDPTKKKSSLTEEDKTKNASNSVWSGSSDGGRPSSEPSLTDWTSSSSNHDAQDQLPKLDLSDVSNAFDFDADIGLNWQSDVIASEA